MKILNTNRKLYHDYFVEEKFEAGIVLTGSEVKSCKAGSIDLSNAYITIERCELIIHEMFIGYFKNSGYVKHVEKAKRKLLMHKREILRLTQIVSKKGFTLLPAKIYLAGNLIKVEVCLCKGKHSYDKRESLKSEEINRELRRIVKN
jgi:SsrA-binding protein